MATRSALQQKLNLKKLQALCRQVDKQDAQHFVLGDTWTFEDLLTTCANMCLPHHISNVLSFFFFTDLLLHISLQLCVYSYVSVAVGTFFFPGLQG